VDLDAYFDRIGFRGEARVDRDTLFAIHRAHLLAIPYENLDVVLRNRVTREPAAAFDKIVRRRRGGWCYEMNGLLAWALEAVGFPVVHMAGAVHRAAIGDETIGNHLVLRIDLEEPFLCDAGFGDGLLDPVPLREGAHEQRGLVFRLEKLGAGWWRFHNHAFGSAPSFDFLSEPADANVLEAQCDTLQSDVSRFVNTLVCQRHDARGIAALRGRTLRRIDQNGVEITEIADEREFAATLRDLFDLAPEDIGALWRTIV
jgi:N-hydroxyarylamine O-acetyltransferase